MYNFYQLVGGEGNKIWKKQWIDHENESFYWRSGLGDFLLVLSTDSEMNSGKVGIIWTSR